MAMATEGFVEIIRASDQDRSDLFLATAQHLGTPLINVEKDFWVCWTLNLLYHRLPSDGPRLLFKGGTSLSKAYGLISRFSEDIDITVFRDDLGHKATTEEITALSGNRRRRLLTEISRDCSAFITGDLRDSVAEALEYDTEGRGRIEIDEADDSRQTLLVWYPNVAANQNGYVRAAVKIESGAKSALEPNQRKTITPYIACKVRGLELQIANVTTLSAEYTFWDKVVIAHGMRSWFNRRGQIRQEGQRISRHYYDLHCILQTDIGTRAKEDLCLGAYCVAHARTFFHRPDFDLESAKPGSFNLVPTDEMANHLEKDYRNMSAMILGEIPNFTTVLASLRNLENSLNR